MAIQSKPTTNVSKLPKRQLDLKHETHLDKESILWKIKFWPWPQRKNCDISNFTLIVSGDTVFAQINWNLDKIPKRNSERVTEALWGLFGKFRFNRMCDFACKKEPKHLSKILPCRDKNWQSTYISQQYQGN